MSKNDMGPPSRASSMRPPPDLSTRFPLMTPSASPPVQRPFARQSSVPSPAKKRRVSRAPSVSGASLRSFSNASASSSSVSPAFNFDASVDPGEELHAARRASSFRVLNVWSQLAEKYARRLDEDDIVDLRKEAIVKDCGVLRSTGDMFEIGYFAEEREKAERLDNGLPLTPVDDEPDELDAFADTPDNISRSETDGDDEDGLGLAQRTKRLPPVRELDPADAADLAEFLQAERERRETLGDLDEEDEGESDEDRDERESEAVEEENDVEDDLDTETAVSRSDAGEEEVHYEPLGSEDDEEEVYEESVHDSDDEGRSHQEYSRFSTPSGSPEFDILEISNVEKEADAEDVNFDPGEEALALPVDADSDDELGGWDRDEGSTLYSVGDFDEESPAEENRESSKESALDATLDPPSNPRKKRTRGNAHNSEPSELAAAVPRKPSGTSSRKKAPVFHSASPAVVQLQTPPRSTSFGPEPSTTKITATYSRKRRGLSSSPKKTPLRIQSTASESSQSETEDAPSPSKPESSPSRGSPTKKAKLVPEVYIDVRPPSPLKTNPKVTAPVEYKNVGSPSKDARPATPQKSAKLKGKAKAVETVEYAYSEESGGETKSFSPSPDVLGIPVSSHSNTTKGNARPESPRKVSSASKKRNRAFSPALDEPEDEIRAADVVMASPTTPSSRRSSRRASSSRRIIVDEVANSYGEHEPGPSSRLSTSRRSRSRPSAEQALPSPSRSRHLPELNTFSFTPPRPPHSPVGYQPYGGSHYSFPHAHQQNSGPLPNLHDPNAQYHLAQALQSLSILMGGALPFSPSPVNPSHIPQPLPSLGQHGHQAWPPYTPRHHNRFMNFDSPQSVATAPPTSSPLGSDYSDSVPSSPTKHATRNRGRSRTQSYALNNERPKSAIRESRSRSRSLRRVSFSSPEATQIEDNAYEYISDNVIEIGSSDGEGNDIERRRLRREEQSIRSFQLRSPRPHARAQTPGPPDRASKAGLREDNAHRSMYSDGEPKRRVKTNSTVQASRHELRKGNR